MKKYTIIDSNIERVSEQIIHSFHDMLKIILTDDKVFLETEAPSLEPNDCVYCNVCVCLDHNFWKDCIDYKIADAGTVKQVIKENKKEEAKQYIIKSINEIIKIHNERSN